MRVRGFAELTYRDSARLSFARACERVDHDVAVDHPHAWVVDDRRISWAIEVEMSASELELHQRLLEDLAKEASGGEVYLDGDGQPRWSVIVGHVVSGIPDARSSDRLSLDTSDTDITGVRSGTRS